MAGFQIETLGLSEVGASRMRELRPVGDGGSGQSFDWSILQHYSGSTPFLLSGGIGPDSVEALRHFHHPKWAGIDLNSKFEFAPAMKNLSLLTDFLQQIKSFQL